MKIAVVLFNLGGPDNLQAVRPFLLNLFSDPAIIRLPNPLRRIVAKFIATLREKKALAIYSAIGGRSPILEETVSQAEALENGLNRQENEHGTEAADEWRVFVSMRYWHPFSSETVKRVKDYQPDEVILLPLYPQFSTATTGSSLDDWKAEAARQKFVCITKRLCCYFAEWDFTQAHAGLIWENYLLAKTAADGKKPRLLFSAHGLPESVVETGDPYQYQIEETVKLIVYKLGEISRDAESQLPREKFDSAICYQSRVGVKKWLQPSLQEMVEKAAAEKTPLVIVPISFVSEHSETLYELDIQYKNLAEKLGVPGYTRVPALATSPLYIKSLSNLAIYVRKQSRKLCSFEGLRACPNKFTGCPHS